MTRNSLEFSNINAKKVKVSVFGKSDSEVQMDIHCFSLPQLKEGKEQMTKCIVATMLLPAHLLHLVHLLHPVHLLFPVLLVYLFAKLRKHRR